MLKPGVPDVAFVVMPVSVASTSTTATETGETDPSSATVPTVPTASSKDSEITDTTKTAAATDSEGLVAARQALLDLCRAVLSGLLASLDTLPQLLLYVLAGDSACGDGNGVNESRQGEG